MNKMSLNQIREAFLRFFESRGHLRLDSFPLIPKDDNSLLLINSGMAPMKNWFLGLENPPSKRVVNCQKCIRTPDIERVGKTSRHGTFFEMLGNFSFGDYFKKEAINWSWEFIVDVLKIPEDRLYVTVFEDDDEAYNIWVSDVKIKKQKIFSLGKEDNFWEIGTGPCGPCSEIYYDMGPDKGCCKKNCAPGCDCDRFIEIWNLVFTQYISDGNGNYKPMRQPNIDTGMGLERIGCIVQQVDNLFLVDSMQSIMKNISAISDIDYGENKKCDTSLRIITDHIRSVVFMAADGIIPSNEGRGYVLRRLLRRAQRNGKLLGIDDPFLYKISETVIEEYKDAYPDLAEKKEYIKKIIKVEEENFYQILQKGMNILNETIDKLDSNMEKLPGKEAFTLFDTYGFPFELIKEMVKEKNLDIDEEGFFNLMSKQKEKSRTSSATQDVGWSHNDIVLKDKPPTEFLGYDSFKCQSTLLHIYKQDGQHRVANTDDIVYLIFDQTPFYAQSGGQVADKGVFSYQNSVANIYDCQKLVSGQFVHKATVLNGPIKSGASGTLSINIERRQEITRNHTGAHLLQKALTQVLGDHVHQAGQLVDDRRIRFDFNHFKSMSKKELSLVESNVNHQILKGIPVFISQMDLQTAKKKGAVALFGEKYEEIVRVVDIKGASIELCGGTHVDNTSKIGLFKILSESSASAGVRRIEATTATGVLKLIDDLKGILLKSSQSLKLENSNDLPDKINNLKQELLEYKKNINRLNSKLMGDKLGDLSINNMTDFKDFKLLSASFNDISKQALRDMGDRVKASAPNVIAAIASIEKNKGTLLVLCGSEAVKKGADANFIIKKLSALAGGNGGGKSSFAMAGIKDPKKLDFAFSKMPDIVKEMMNS